MSEQTTHSFVPNYCAPLMFSLLLDRVPIVRKTSMRSANDIPCPRSRTSIQL